MVDQRRIEFTSPWRQFYHRNLDGSLPRVPVREMRNLQAPGARRQTNRQKTVITKKDIGIFVLAV